MKQWLRRGALAKALGTSTPTIKHYTEIGLLDADERTPNGQFLYDYERSQIRFQRIQELKNKRHTLTEIKERLQIESLVENIATS